MVNDRGELLALRLTPGNVSDANKTVVTGLTKGLNGKLFGDKGYLSKELFEQLWRQGLQAGNKHTTQHETTTPPVMGQGAVTETVHH